MLCILLGLLAASARSDARSCARIEVQLHEVQVEPQRAPPSISEGDLLLGEAWTFRTAKAAKDNPTPLETFAAPRA